MAVICLVNTWCPPALQQAQTLESIRRQAGAMTSSSPLASLCQTENWRRNGHFPAGAVCGALGYLRGCTTAFVGFARDCDDSLTPSLRCFYSKGLRDGSLTPSLRCSCRLCNNSYRGCRYMQRAMR
jgi:hypothetical protein